MMRSAVDCEPRLVLVLVCGRRGARCGGRSRRSPGRRRRRRRRRPAPARAGRRRRPSRCRADHRAARAGARRRICLGVARRSEPELAAEAGVLRATTAASSPATAQAVLDENAGAAEAVSHLDRDDRRSLRRARHRRVQSGIGRAARGGGARLSGVARHLRPIGCGRSATARSSRSIRVTTRRRSRRTAARISSSPRNEKVMKQTVSRAFVALVAGVAPSPAPAAAANKEQQQMMADIRMLQEQAQQLQNLLGALTEALKAVNARLDQQTEANRKAFADQKLVIDTLAERSAGRAREDRRQQRADRLAVAGSRRAAPVGAAAAAPRRPRRRRPSDRRLAAPARRRSAPPPPPPAGAAAVGASPQKLFDRRRADYTAGQYDLAIARLRGLHQEPSRSPTWPTMRRSTSATPILPGRQERQGGRSLRHGDPHLPERQRGSRRLLQEGDRAQRSQADRAGARGVRVRGRRTFPTATPRRSPSSSSPHCAEVTRRPDSRSRRP